MRRINSEFKTANMSEEGHKLSNRDYFGYVEMDDFACYVLADSLDEEPAVSRIAVPDFFIVGYSHNHRGL